MPPRRFPPPGPKLTTSVATSASTASRDTRAIPMAAAITCSQRAPSFEMVARPRVATWYRSRSPTSATLTGKRARSRSFRLFTTRRRSLSERAPGIEITRRATPTNTSSQRLLDGLDLEGLDDVAHRDVVEALERDTAVEAFLDLARVVLEALQARELAVPDLGAVAHELHVRGALHHALDHHAARDVARLRDAEHL